MVTTITMAQIVHPGGTFVTGSEMEAAQVLKRYQ